MDLQTDAEMALSGYPGSKHCGSSPLTDKPGSVDQSRAECLSGQQSAFRSGAHLHLGVEVAHSSQPGGDHSAEDGRDDGQRGRDAAERQQQRLRDPGRPGLAHLRGQQEASGQNGHARTCPGRWCMCERGRALTQMTRRRSCHSRACGWWPQQGLRVSGFGFKTPP